MRFPHWVTLGIVFIVAYYVGAKWPGMAQRAGLVTS